MLNYCEKPVRIENGKKIFRFDCIVDTQRRPAEPSEEQKPVDQDNSESDSPVPVVATGDNLVRDRWRLISAVKAWPTTGLPVPQMVDYGHDGGRVLQEAIGIINNVNPDLTWNHSTDARDVAGHVENAHWEASFDIPPGINADLVVDPDYDHKAATGLQKGQLRNGSIGFTMDVAPSHEDMEWAEFIEKQGEEINGKQVCWFPTQVFDVRHMALVPAGTGADQYAGRRNKADNLATKTNRRNGMEGNIDFFQSVFEALGIDVLLAENTEVSAATQERVKERIEKLSGIKDRYNVLAEGLQKFGRELTNDGDTPLSAVEVLARLGDLHELAKRGERLVEFKQQEAVEWFDKAKFAPDKAELSESEHRMRGRIMASMDLDYLEDVISEYRSIAQEKFELNRSSVVDELPPIDAAKPIEGSIDIAEASRKLFGK